MKLRRRSYLDPSQVLRSRPEVVHVGSLVLAPRRAMNFIALLGFAGVDIKQLERERERETFTILHFSTSGSSLYGNKPVTQQEKMEHV